MLSLSLSLAFFLSHSLSFSPSLPTSPRPVVRSTAPESTSSLHWLPLLLSRQAVRAEKDELTLNVGSDALLANGIDVTCLMGGPMRTRFYDGVTKLDVFKFYGKKRGQKDLRKVSERGV